MPRTIAPFWGHGRATVIESPVDETQLTSGLVVPMSYDGDDHVKRGVVLKCAYATEYPEGFGTHLGAGTVIYYLRATKVSAEVWVVDLDDVIAIEEGD